MPRYIVALIALTAGGVLLLAGAGRAQTLTDLGTNALTPGTYDLYQLSTAGNQTAPDGLNYYTDNQTGHAPASRARLLPPAPTRRDTRCRP